MHTAMAACIKLVALCWGLTPALLLLHCVLKLT
jgi:hypothetical protein